MAASIGFTKNHPMSRSPSIQPNLIPATVLFPSSLTVGVLKMLGAGNSFQSNPIQSTSSPPISNRKAWRARVGHAFCWRIDLAEQVTSQAKNLKTQISGSRQEGHSPLGQILGCSSYGYSVCPPGMRFVANCGLATSE